MAVFTHAYLAGVWQKAKCVWWWDGAAWQKAIGVYRYDGATWKQGFAAPDLPDTVAGATDSASYPATIIFTWSLTGQAYGASLELFANGLSWQVYDPEVNPTGDTVTPVDPTATWTLELRDGNGDLIRTRTAIITGP